MKKYFWSLCTAGLLLAFAGAYSQDTQKQHKKYNKVQTDTASDTRLQKNTMPPLQKTDSLPVPRPGQPLPDTLLKRH